MFFMYKKRWQYHIAFGGIPYTLEYNPLSTNDKRLHIMTPIELAKNPRKFDVILSVSSIEHDGLGRYGDPINPDGDIDFMSNAKDKLLKEGGHMFIAFPVGRDCLCWNAHRIYGPIRLRKLFQGWIVQDSFGFSTSDCFKPLGEFCQPVFCVIPSL